MNEGRLETILWSGEVAESVSAVEALPRTPDATTASALEGRLRKRAPAALATAVLRALGAIGSAAQEGVLVRYVANPNVEIRQVALSSLLKVSQETGVEVAVDLSTGDPHSSLRECCKQFLRAMPRGVLEASLGRMRQQSGTWQARAASRYAAMLDLEPATTHAEAVTFDEVWSCVYVRPQPREPGAEKPWFYEGEIGIDGLFDETADSEGVVFLGDAKSAATESSGEPSDARPSNRQGEPRDPRSNRE